MSPLRSLTYPLSLFLSFRLFFRPTLAFFLFHTLSPFLHGGRDGGCGRGHGKVYVFDYVKERVDIRNLLRSIVYCVSLCLSECTRVM